MAVLVVAALAVGVVVLGSGGGSGSEPQAEAAPTTAPPAAWDPRVAPIAAWVADWRGLDYEYPVEVVFLAPDAYTEAAVGRDDDEDPGENEEEMQEAIALLRALGLLHGELDLVGDTEALVGEGSLAFYSPREEKVYVRGTELTPGVRATLAHELTHVLQDQHFDLTRLSDPDFDRSTVLRTLAEGDAGRVEDAYVKEVFSDDERDEHGDESVGASDEAQEALADIDPTLMAMFISPYVLGRSFVQYLEAIEGDEAIDIALREPPTEQEMLDPSVRGTPRAEEVPVEVSAPSGAEVLDEDELGPMTWYMLLAARGDPAEALATVDGWGGDAFVAYRSEERTCIVAAVAGDTAADTELFHIRLTAWAAADPGGNAEVTRSEEVVAVRSCDPGPDAVVVGEPNVDHLLVPAVRTEVAAMLLSGGVGSDQAWCSANRMVEELPIDELTGQAPDSTADLQRRAGEIILSCR